jgi:hypothetical protein
MTTPGSAKRSRLEIWWWTSVPYLLIFAALVLILKPTPGILAHILLPLLILFWVALYSSLAWVAVSLFRMAWSLVSLLWGVHRRPMPVTLSSIGSLVLGIAACLLGVYLEFFWTGNMG